MDFKRLGEDEGTDHLKKLEKLIAPLARKRENAGADEVMFMGRVVSKYFFNEPLSRIKITDVYDGFQMIAEEISQYKDAKGKRIEEIRDLCLLLSRTASTESNTGSHRRGMVCA